MSFALGSFSFALGSFSFALLDNNPYRNGSYSSLTDIL